MRLEALSVSFVSLLLLSFSLIALSAAPSRVSLRTRALPHGAGRSALRSRPKIAQRPSGIAPKVQQCSDSDGACASWVASDRGACQRKEYIKKNCRKSCGNCPIYEAKFDTNRLNPQLQPIRLLVGRWKGEHTGKVTFPTIPTFKYSEEVEISIPEGSNIRSLNYTAAAWSSDKEDLHRESGYITIKPNTREVILTTVMSNGFITVEEGPLSGNSIKFILKDIGRISFVRDEHLHNLVREWTLDQGYLRARLSIQTLSHRMQEHTSILYTKTSV